MVWCVCLCHGVVCVSVCVSVSLSVSVSVSVCVMAWCVCRLAQLRRWIRFGDELGDWSDRHGWQWSIEPERPWRPCSWAVIAVAHPLISINHSSHHHQHQQQSDCTEDHAPPGWDRHIEPCGSTAVLWHPFYTLSPLLRSDHRSMSTIHHLITISFCIVSWICIGLDTWIIVQWTSRLFCFCYTSFKWFYASNIHCETIPKSLLCLYVLIQQSTMAVWQPSLMSVALSL